MTIRAVDRPFAMSDGSSVGQRFQEVIAMYVRNAMNLNDALSSRSPPSAFRRVKNLLEEAWVCRIMQSASRSTVAVMLTAEPTVTPETLLGSFLPLLGSFLPHGEEVSRDAQNQIAQFYPFGGLYVAGLERKVRGEMRSTKSAMMIGIFRISGPKTTLVDNLFNQARRWCKKKKFTELLVCPYDHLIDRLKSFGFKTCTSAERETYGRLYFGEIFVDDICGDLLRLSL